MGGTERAVGVVRATGRGCVRPGDRHVLTPPTQACRWSLRPRASSAWDEVLGCEPRPAPVPRGGRHRSRPGGGGRLRRPRLAPTWWAIRRVSPSSRPRGRLYGLSQPDDVVAVGRRRGSTTWDGSRSPVRVCVRPAPLTRDDWEQVRLHAYYARACAQPRTVPRCAGTHRGRPPRAAGRLGLPPRRGCGRAHTAGTPARRRRHVPRDDAGATPPGAVHPGARRPRSSTREARAGRLEADGVSAVLEVSGQRVPHIEGPAGLTAREAEVVALLARGLQTKQVARAARHLQQDRRPPHPKRLRRRSSISTRASAALFAMQHGLTACGESPIPAPHRRP